MRFQMRFAAGLDGFFSTWRDFLAVMLFFLLNLFVVRDISWICHGVAFY